MLYFNWLMTRSIFPCMFFFSNKIFSGSSILLLMVSILFVRFERSQYVLSKLPARSTGQLNIYNAINWYHVIPVLCLYLGETTSQVG